MSKSPVDIPFPIGGIAEAKPYATPPANTVGKPSHLLNVRAHDALERRARGGQRTGMSRYFDQQLAGGATIQNLSTIVEAVPISTTAEWGSAYSGDGGSGTNKTMLAWRPDGSALAWFRNGFDAVQITFFDATTGWGSTVNWTAVDAGFGPDVFSVGWTTNSRICFAVGDANETGFGLAIVGASSVSASQIYELNTPWSSSDRKLGLSAHPSGWLALGNIAVKIDPDATSLPSEAALNATLIDLRAGTNGAGDICAHFFPPQWEDRIIQMNASDNLFRVFEFDADAGTVGSELYQISATIDATHLFLSMAENGWAVYRNTNPGGMHTVRFGENAALEGQTRISSIAFDNNAGMDLSADGSYVFFKTSNSEATLTPHALYAAEFFGSSLGLKFETNVVEQTGEFNRFAYSSEAGVAAFVNEATDTILARPFNGPEINPGGRLPRVVAVAGGSIYRSDAPPTTLTTVDGSSAVLDASVPIMSSVLLQRMFFCDGRDAGYCYYDVRDDQVHDWRGDVTAGELPTDESDQGARIITTYRSRIVLAGLESEPQNWFMSAVGDAFDWDYSPATTSSAQAVAGNASDAGQVGDVVTALIPYQDDLLFIGGVASVWVLRGDPAAGGQIDNMTRQVGVVGAHAWAQDTVGNIYFMGNNGLYRIGAGATSLDLVSKGKLDHTFEEIDYQANNVRLVYDREWQGVHIFITPLDEPDEPTDHYFWDQRTNSFWRDQYPVAFGPTAVHLHENDDPDSRGVLLGGFDGRIRRFDSSSLTDDGETIESHVRFPLLHPSLPMGQFQMRELQVTLGSGGAGAYFDILRGDTPQAAAEAGTAAYSKLLVAGRNLPLRKAIRANALAFKIRGDTDAGGEPWAYEAGSVIVGGVGRMRKGL